MSPSTASNSADWEREPVTQLDLFSPNDGVYEYQVIATNKTLEAQNLMDFFNGRCAMEHDIAELKGEFAFDVIPTKDWEANSAHQQLSLLGYNLVKNFQIDANLTKKRSSGSSRTAIFSFGSLKTLRFEWINAAGRIVVPQAPRFFASIRTGLADPASNVFRPPFGPPDFLSRLGQALSGNSPRSGKTST